MAEAGRQPCCRPVTIAALGNCLDMCGRFACRLSAVVAVGAGAGHRSVIDDTNRCPGGGQVTGLAITGGRNVRGILAGGAGAIVTR